MPVKGILHALPPLYHRLGDRCRSIIPDPLPAPRITFISRGNCVYVLSLQVFSGTVGRLKADWADGVLQEVALSLLRKHAQLPSKLTLLGANFANIGMLATAMVAVERASQQAKSGS